jgi:hypothetical protein
MASEATDTDLGMRRKRPYHGPTIEHIGSVADVTNGNPTTGTADDANYGPAKTS